MQRYHTMLAEWLSDMKSGGGGNFSKEEICYHGNHALHMSAYVSIMLWMGLGWGKYP